MRATHFGGGRALVIGDDGGIRPTVALTRLGQPLRGEHPVQADGGLTTTLLSPAMRFVNGAIVPCDAGMGAGFTMDGYGRDQRLPCRASVVRART